MFLKDIKVLDIGSYVAGPATATVMADFGADVVKIEPLDGDPYRTLLGLVTQDYPDFFWALDSRNKRSLSIDMNEPEGRRMGWREFRRDPGFLDLVEELEFVDYWKAYGWPDDKCSPLGDSFVCDN